MQIDVGSNESVQGAAGKLQQDGINLSAIVNNAGIGFCTDPDSVEELMNVNFYGPKRVVEAFVPLLDTANGRIVNVSSGAASMWLRSQSEKNKALFSSPESWNQLNEAVQQLMKDAPMGGYGLSKAALTAYTILLSRQYPDMKCTSLSPGLINTKMTAQWNVRLTPDEGTVSLMRCLFDDVTSGFYYGSDGLRSPLTVTRDPGTPEYEGEENPDPARYNK